MSTGIVSKHGKLLAEIVVPSSTWHLQPEKQDPFKSHAAAVEYLDSHNEPLYLLVPITQSDDILRICVTSQNDDVIFTINDIQNGGETSLHYSHLKNLESTVRTLVSETSDKKIKSL
ncbi:hypothetical protein D210916BOD24_15290 [Alteromonas sp. D210916BOD_24]|uniref:hypothetical protein n=1 Tax=Alteromonas sp. D210916BOD_24 TaxID=3157618 RepID=UPI00399C602D